MLKKIVLGLVGLVVLVAVVGLVLTSSYSVERSLAINAPVSVVFAQVNDLTTWEAWGPWIQEDSTIAITYDSVTVGAGASYSWTGKDGGGTLTIAESVENSAIETDLDFGSMGSGTGHWTFEEAEGGTNVTWGMDGQMPYSFWGVMFRYMAAFSDLDAELGSQFERGLTNIKGIVEAMPTKPEAEQITEK